MTGPRRAVRGRLVWFEADPRERGRAVRDLEDGLLVIEDGRITAIGEAAALLPALSAATPVDHHPDHLILPGLIDPHIHFPQTQVIASYGAQLLDWLKRYTFVEEQRFADPAHAARIAGFFCDELLRNGTTTACVFGSVHPAAAEALFEEAARRRLRLVGGKVMMDQNAPPALTDTAERGYRETKDLIARWHGRDRLGVAISPRFAITSSEGQLEAAGTLAREHPDCLIQTHLAENQDEIRTVAGLFPWAKSYTDVYDHFGLLGPRSLFGHCLHLSDGEARRLAASGSVAVFCPTSNLFIGSGLFARARLMAEGVRVALATDVGGGTSYSMLQTAAEAYKVLHLGGETLHPFEAFHLMTRGNALAMGLDGTIGTLAPGAEADLVVLDPRATPAMAHRMERIAGDLAEILFVLMTLGDDRAVRVTYVLGEPAHVR